jgi:hypothetical protein
MYRFAKFKTDFQFLGGWMGKDYVLGGGWSGDIKGGGFRGEVSWFIPRESDNGSYEAVVASSFGRLLSEKQSCTCTEVFFTTVTVQPAMPAVAVFFRPIFRQKCFRLADTIFSDKFHILLLPCFPEVFLRC